MENYYGRNNQTKNYNRICRQIPAGYLRLHKWDTDGKFNNARGRKITYVMG